MTLCQSVSSFHSPDCWSFQRRPVAIGNLVTAVPLGVNLVSASLPRFPTRITLLTLRDAIITCTVTHLYSPHGAHAGRADRSRIPPLPIRADGLTVSWPQSNQRRTGSATMSGTGSQRQSKFTKREPVPGVFCFYCGSFRVAVLQGHRRERSRGRTTRTNFRF